MEKIIEVDSLVKIYKTLTAVKGISFFVNKGEIFGLLGPNGAGKTTTLEIMEGLKKQTSGFVKILGLDNLKQTDEVKKKIGIQLQESGFLPNLTVRELLELFASLYQQHEDLDQLLQVTNLTAKQNEYADSLSGGQKQRLSLALALCHKPEIIFLDEPTTGLDPQARRNLWQMIKEINQKGTTVVLTTHYMEEAEYLCHRVGIIDEGKILEIDEPAKLIDNLSKTTQVSFLTDKKLEETFLTSLPDVTKVYNNFPKIVLEINSLTFVGDIAKKLKESKIPFFGFTVKTASLEDVYLDLTGKEFEDA